jgi:two-component system sensor kinase FixL
VALLDEALPGMTGVEVCRRLRKRRSAPLRYLILLTAAHGGTELAAALEDGADDCVRLPYREEELRARVDAGLRLVKKHELLDRRLSSIEESLSQYRKTEAQLRILTESLPVLMTYLDSEQRYRYSTRHFDKWLGQPGTSFYGKHQREILGEEAYQAVRPHVETALSGRRVTFEGVVPSRIENKRFIRVTYIPDLTNGTTRGLFCFVHDLTEQPLTEGETDHLQGELAQTERLAWLGAMTAALAHELSQPLAAILSNAQAALRFLKADPPDVGEVQAILKDIVQDDRRAGDVMRSLRDYTRQDTPHNDLLQINTLVHDALRLIHSDAILNQVAVAEDLSDDVPMISGDAIQVQQVLLNLLSNAIEALSETPVDQRVILITTSVGADGHARICVRDRGPGIAADRLNTLFEPLQTRTVGGKGIGLVVSRTIVTWHGGRIWAENHPEGGARLCVEFPPVASERCPGEARLR